VSDPVSGTASASVELVKSGILGAVFVFVTVPLAVYTRYLSNLLKEANDARALAEQQRSADAKAVVDKMLALNDKWNAALADHSHVLATLNETLKDNKEALKDVRDLFLEAERDRNRGRGGGRGG
jgi:molybdopterin converting factor small subunit